MKIGLLGGGITSLAIGHFLKKPYEILEKEDRLGGLCCSIVDKGYTFDIHGAHILFSKNKDILKLEKKLVGKNLKQRRRENRIYFKGKLVKYPFENDLGSLDKEDTYECLYNYLFNDCRKPSNLEEWCYYTFGKGIAEKYLVPYNRKIWKTDPKKMSMEWIERIPKPPKEDILKSSLGIPTEGHTHQLYYLYPEVGGIEALITAFGKNSKREITKGFDIDGIYQENNKWIVTSGKQRKEYDRIVSTIPIFELVRVLKNITIPYKVRNAIEGLEYRSLITVMLGLDAPSLTNITAIYFPELDFYPHRVCFPPSFSPLNVPKRHFSVMAEITVSKSKSYLKMPKSKIYNNVINGLIKRKIIQNNSVVYKNMFVTEYAYPVYDKNYVRSMSVIKNYLKSVNIYSCGRFGGFEYINTDTCIEKGKKLAEELNLLQ